MTDQQLSDLKKQIDAVVKDYFNELVSLRLSHEQILRRFQEQLSKQQQDAIKKKLNI